MKSRWIPIKDKFELNDMAIVTRKINKNKLDVTIGLPAWGLQNNTIAYMDMPEVTNNMWKSEYRGDELPKVNRSFIVLLIGTKDYNYNKHRIIDSYFLVEKLEWLRIPNDWEVYAWMEYPKPFKG